MSKSKTVRVPRIVLHSGQQAIMDGVQESRQRGTNKFVVVAGRQFGKTAMSIDYVTGLLLEGKAVGWYTPTKPDSEEVFRDFVRAFGGEDSPLIRSVSRQSNIIELVNGGHLKFLALDKDGAGRGLHFDAVILDECAKARNLLSAIDETIMATLLAKQGIMWILSTPRGKEAFWDLYLQGQRGLRSIRSFHVPSWANPYLSKQYLLDIKADLYRRGRGWVWRQEYCGLPADSGGNPFGLDILQRQLQQAPTGRPVRAFGLDLARKHDYTVLIGYDDNRKIASLDRWKGVEWQDQYKRIEAISNRYPSARILADSTGVGDAVVSSLRAKGLPVRPFQFTSASRANLLDSYQISLAEGDAWVLAGQHDLEMQSAEWRERGGRSTIWVPDHIHDDCLMAGALCDKLANDIGLVSGGLPIVVQSNRHKRAQSQSSKAFNSLRGYA